MEKGDGGLRGEGESPFSALHPRVMYLTKIRVNSQSINLLESIIVRSGQMLLTSIMSRSERCPAGSWTNIAWNNF